MTPIECSGLFAVALIGAAAANAAHAQGGSAAQQNYDGLYAVDIVTRHGSCDRGYHWMILVSGGRVSSAGDTLMEASGQISRRGIVALAFERFGQIATVTGKLARGAGSGTWSSTTMQCAGSWQATRRGWAGH
ncbi:MAG: hypothetical protein ACR2KT_08005 [Methylocella sp.]|nr:MAG: hypothetical protein DLM68_14415 [Hyphomicrobiales bacterium]